MRFESRGRPTAWGETEEVGIAGIVGSLTSNDEDGVDC